ncbi:type III-B CRISPR module-associated Cmr3 family protein [Maridesulfovibrio sp.]|uniref:type III-B CRISPR module-associated Cmr3 family protein n=1 Tax=Maridesulfovibrio sp. TaxID=2795000 RepID=UPI0029F5663A|nr:type III-B CRISPR module-associated Cmr3 family protein [Maridesulfovibrio sp.]
MFVEISPLDTIFCRDSRSFGMEEAHAVDSVFPPPPSVMFGAMRGSIFITQGFANMKRESGFKHSWPAWFGNTESSGNLFQRGPLPVIDEQIMFPLPLDGFLEESEASEYGFTPFQLLNNNASASNLDLEFTLVPPKDKRLPKQTDIMWISADALSKYLNYGSIPTLKKEADIYQQEELWTAEHRTNVGIDPNTNAGKDSILFSLKHVRMNTKRKAKLLCQWGSNDCAEADEILKGIINCKSNSLSVAGERRTASVTNSELKWPTLPANEFKPDEQGYVSFRLYMATPAYFAGGWRPQPAEDNECVIKSSAGEIKATLLAAAVGKPFYLGGYDIQKKQQRPARSFVPAGCVYHFKAKADQLDIISQLNGQVVGDNDFLKAQGFGLCFVGKPSSDIQE